jgi:isopenicillin-N epimerase
MFISGCHKWLFGPRGTGIVWGSADGWNIVRSTIPSFDGRAYSAWLEGREPSQIPGGPWMTPGGFHSFEHRWALAEAFRFHDQIGAEAIADRTHALATQLKEGLADIDGITVHTPADTHLSSGIVCFSVDGIPSELIVDALESKLHVLASVTPYRQAFVRFMPSLVNAPDEIEEALLALRTLTTHRGGSL